jgi:hypothetical protein
MVADRASSFIPGMQASVCGKVKAGVVGLVSTVAASWVSGGGHRFSGDCGAGIREQVEQRRAR